MRQQSELSRKHVGPGRKIVSIYAEERLHERIKARAAALGFSVSEYVMLLAQNDISCGGPIQVFPLAA